VRCCRSWAGRASNWACSLHTGLLISFPAAGCMVAAGIACRLLALRLAGPGVRDRMEVFAGGVIAGDALYSFFSGAFKALRK
jgi:hypothetical protein